MVAELDDALLHLTAALGILDDNKLDVAACHVQHAIDLIAEGVVMPADLTGTNIGHPAPAGNLTER